MFSLQGARFEETFASLIASAQSRQRTSADFYVTRFVPQKVAALRTQGVTAYFDRKLARELVFLVSPSHESRTPSAPLLLTLTSPLFITRSWRGNVHRSSCPGKLAQPSWPIPVAVRQAHCPSFKATPDSNHQIESSPMVFSETPGSRASPLRVVEAKGAVPVVRRACVILALKPSGT